MDWAYVCTQGWVVWKGAFWVGWEWVGLGLVGGLDGCWLERYAWQALCVFVYSPGSAWIYRYLHRIRRMDA